MALHAATCLQLLLEDFLQQLQPEAAAERTGASDPGALAIMYDGGAEDSEETLNIVE
jgi:hypothetical protein